MNLFRAFALCLALGSCKTITSPTVTNIAADCGSPALRDLASHLLDDVTSALLSGGDYRVALANVAARAGADGWAAVKCAVTEVFGQSKAQLLARASMDKATADRTQTLVDRAGTWLGEHP
jgi:hypothetical protein